jgi:RNA polymerase sigma factor (sigma-70 family)
LDVDQTEFDSILPAAQSGADWAWARIYHEFAGRIRGYVRRHGTTDPDNLVGEVFLQLARNIGTFEGTEANFRSWVFTVAHHRILDDRRRRTRRPAESMAETPEPTTALPDSTSEAALDAVASDRVQQLIDLLVPNQREVLLLRIVGGLTISEIAAVVGKNVGAVKALQRRGLAALQRILEQQGVSL